MNTLIKPLSIVIAIDRSLINIGFHCVIKSHFPGCEITDANNGWEVIKLLEENPDKFELVIADIQLKTLNGIETTALIKQKFPKVKVIGFSMFADEYYILEIFRKGAKGYLLCNSKPEEIITAIQTVLNGGKYFHININQVFIKYINTEIEHAISNKPDVQEKLHDTIFLLCNEKDNDEMAIILNLSFRSIEHYRSILTECLVVRV